MKPNLFISTSRVEDQARQAGRMPGRRTAQVTGMEPLDRQVWRMTIQDPYLAAHAPAGAFINLYSADRMTMMPRPFGISRVLDGEQIEIVFAVVGQGTYEFSRLQPGMAVDLLGPLGHGFDLEKPAHYLLVGGGLGVPPLIRAAQCLQGRSAVRTTALLGYRDHRFADAIMGSLTDQLESIDNASGDVITLLDRVSGDIDTERTIILTCGPLPMMRAVAAWARKTGLPAQCCMESRMGCGYGTCVACVVDTVDGRLKVCKDGPVFAADRLIWDAEGSKEMPR